jgi:demethylmenaquinone methyltransferase/2-methoxy-6-polyprenyl-1,4-benzoquinol methylase
METEKPKNGGEETTDFGFRQVSAPAKTKLVDDVFARVAPHYDLMNDLMSVGIHRLWKRVLIDHLNPRPGMRLLDVAGGTGDIAFRFLDRTQAKGHDAPANTEAFICDRNEAMLRIGANRAIDRGHLRGLRWICGSAEALPVASASVDAYVISFGLRNVTRIDAALEEAARVLKPGGHFLCLEFSRVLLPGLAGLYDAYSFHVIPLLGQVVAKDREAYRYLVESIRRFPSQEDLSTRLRTAGLERVRVRNLSGGIAAIHSAWRV